MNMWSLSIQKENGLWMEWSFFNFNQFTTHCDCFAVSHGDLHWEVTINVNNECSVFEV